MERAGALIGLLVFVALLGVGVAAAWSDRGQAALGFGTGFGLGIGLAAAFGVINWAVSALDRLKG